MPTTARRGHAAASDNDGNIYAIGGRKDFDVLATVEKWDGSSWSSIPNMPTNRAYLTAVSDNGGNIYAIGGSNDNGIVATVEKYSVPSPPSAPTNLTAQVI